MKLLKTILGLIIVAFVGLVMLRSMAYGPLKFDTDKIYTASIEDENHILVFTDDYKMLLYRYGEEEEQNPYNKNQSMKYYYGVETVYKYILLLTLPDSLLYHHSLHNINCMTRVKNKEQG